MTAAAPTRMTARSVVLSVLLGAHPAAATSAELRYLTADFDIKESTLRVALTRLVGAGDLVRDADGYRLSDRLLARQRRQDDALAPRLKPWDGTWTTLVVTGAADARSRTALRKYLQDNRFAELREGVWLRPDNLENSVAVAPADRTRVLHSVDDDPAELAGRLWNLPAWSSAAGELLEAMAAATDVPGRFVTAAGIVRHLLTDPVLPEALLPGDWPGTLLRAEYTLFAAELAALRAQPEAASSAARYRDGVVPNQR